MSIEIKYSIHIFLLLSCAFMTAMEPQEGGSSGRIARLMEGAPHYNSDHPNPHFPRRQLRQQEDTPQALSAIRQFKIEDYRTVERLFDSQIIDDSFQNCPPSLTNELNILVNHSYSQTPEIYNNLPNRFIFVGPSGCGKTVLSYVIGYKTRRPYAFIKCAELSNSFKGSCPDIINGLFKPLIDSQQPGLIILDEFMAFMKKYDNKNDSDPGAVEHLWQTLEEAKIANRRLLVICTANDISSLTAAFLTRFGGTQHKFDQPSDARREKLIKQIVHSSEHAHPLIKTLIKQTKSISLREMADVFSKAKLKAAIRAEPTGAPIQVTPEDISSALQPVLKEYSDRLWTKRKEKAWEVIKITAPYAITISLAAAGLYLTWYLHTKQAALAEKNHEESLSSQRSIQEESKTFQSSLQAAAQKHADTLHRENMASQRSLQEESKAFQISLQTTAQKHSEALQQKQHDATHGVGPTLKQSTAQVTTSLVTFGATAGIKWYVKEKWGIEL